MALRALPGLFFQYPFFKEAFDFIVAKVAVAPIGITLTTTATQSILVLFVWIWLAF